MEFNEIFSSLRAVLLRVFMVLGMLTCAFPAWTANHQIIFFDKVYFVDNKDTVLNLIRNLESKQREQLAKTQDLKKRIKDQQIELANPKLKQAQMKQLQFSVEGTQQQLAESHYLFNQFSALLSQSRKLRYLNKKEQASGLQSINKKMLALNKLKKIKIEWTGIELPEVDRSENEFADQTYHCQIHVSSDKKVKATSYHKLFAYTDPKLESYFKEGDFVQSDCRVIKSKSNWFLELSLSIASTKANTIYGTMAYSNPVRLSFIDGDFVYLRNIGEEAPAIDEKNNRSVYKLQFKLDKDKFKKLKKKELDRIIFLWNNGMESYELLQFNLIQNMISCLEQKN